MGTTKKYWKGLEELKNDPEIVRSKENEFAEPVPIEAFLENNSIQETSTSRRDFLKFLGFSVTAASLAACEAPVNKAIPYVVKPEEITPGVANWYASAYFDGQDYCDVLVKTREGRPIKIEPNPNSPLSKGSMNARVQASVLSLYDSARITGPYAKNAETTWENADKEITRRLDEVQAKGSGVRIVSSTIISPSTKQAIADFSAKYPNTRHVTYDAVSYYGILKANSISFNKAVIPSYNFDKAHTIVGISADFLGNWLSPIEYSRQYIKNRKVSSAKREMSKHIQFETTLTITGSKADVRVPIKPSQVGTVVVNLYNAISKLAGGTVLSSSNLPVDDKIAEAAKLLWQNKQRSLVVCGSNNVAIQMVVNSINALLDNYENSIDLNVPSFIKQGNDEAFVELVNEMKEGKVGAIIFYNSNPVYTAPAALNFADALKKVGLKISFADRIDETAAGVDFVCPDHHYLESWNDANPRKGHYSLTQPTIAPLFSKPRFEGTRAAQESLLKWSGNTGTDYYTYIQKFWEKNIFTLQSKESFFTAFWNKSLHDGFAEVTNEAAAAEKPVVAGDLNLNEAAQTISKSAKGGEFELVLYEKTGIGNGNQANNPWLQELPDPVSRVTWDNYITMSPRDMEERKYSIVNSRGEYDGNIVNITVNGVTVKAPVYAQPGQPAGTIGLALGYGRTHAGKVANNVGANAYPLVQLANGTLQYSAPDVQIADTSEKHVFAATQTHHTMMGRDIVRETTLTEYKKDPASGNPPVLLPTHDGAKPPEEVNLWDEHAKLNHRWGMAIDLNSCIGCGSCVVSCTAENNVPVVGKDEVRRSREMHWIRIDRYYSSDMTKEKAKEEKLGAIDMYLEMEIPSADNPAVTFQPIMCQHCNHAPCETVCPVLATNHSSEGLNQMTYNRCIGTRYCANNCPYKVRRFNWFNYSGNEKFGDVNPALDQMERMVLNPDVVVRSRGVIEKCSLCVQRIQLGKLNAKKEMRRIKDGEIQTACAQACPTNAIIFGDYNDANSEIARLDKDERSYTLLREVGTQPNVLYMTYVRNTSETENQTV